MQQAIEAEAPTEPSKGGQAAFARPTRLAYVHEAAIVLLALGGLAAGYLAWRLSIGTISIHPAIPYVETALERVVGGQTTIGQLRLGFDQERRDFVVAAGDISVTTDARTSPLALGQVNLTLNARALVLGQAEITRADLSGMRAVLILDKAGRTAFGFGTPEEVLALPRAKARSQGIRALLDSVRKTLLPDRASGRVEAISLRNGRLTLIDPDTSQRLTLNNARASISANAQNVVTMQVMGAVAEMGGLGNLAVSASPDPKKRLVLAAAFTNARFDALPNSVRVGPLQRAGEISTPLSGKVLAYLGEEGSPFDVRAALELGQGRLFGVDMARASGKFVWDGDQKSFRFEELRAAGPKTLIDDGTGALTLQAGGQRAISFKAEGFDLDVAQLGRLAGRQVNGNARVDKSLFPLSGGLTGQSLSYARDPKRQVVATQFTAQLSAASGTGGVQSLSVKSRAVSGQWQGRRLETTDSKVALAGVRRGTRVSVTQAQAQAGRAQLWATTAGLAPNADAADVTLMARGFAPSRYLPNDIDVKMASLMVSGPGNGAFSTKGENVQATLTQLATPNARLQASVAGLSSKSGNGASGPIGGQKLVLDVRRTGDQSAQIDVLEASQWAVRHPKFAATARDLSVTGRLTPQGLSGGQVVAASLVIDSPEEFLRPFLADNVRLTGDFTPRSLDVSAFAFQHQGLNLKGATAIALASRGAPKIDLTADVAGPLPVNALMSAWPKHFLPETRELIFRLVPEGTAIVDRLALAIPAGMKKNQILPRDGIDLAFRVFDATVNYLSPLTPITSVSGQGELTGNSLAMDFSTGQIGTSQMRNATLAIPEFKVAGAHAYISADIDGDVSEIASVIDTPPLAILSKANMDPVRLSGRGQAHVTLDIPLKRDIRGEDILVVVDGRIQNAGLAKAFAGLDATGGDVALLVDKGLVKVSGQASLADNRFDFEWSNVSPTDGPAVVRLHARGNVEVTSLKQLGLNMDAYGQGSIGLVVDTSGTGNQFGEGNISADFVNTNIQLPGKAWIKTQGTYAAATAKLFPREGGGWNVQDLRFDSSGMTLRGALDLTEAGDLAGARFSRVFIEGASDLAVDLTRAPQSLTVALRGAYLNLAPFLTQKNVTEQAVDLFDRPLSLSADIAKVSTGVDQDLTKVHADIERDTIGWRSLRASGQSLAGASDIELLAGQDGRRTISGVLSDAGFFAQLLYPGAPLFGGTGVIEGELPVVGANSSGSLTFRGKDIQLIRSGSAPILFDDVQLLMQVRGGVVTLSDGLANGAAYTVKAAGYVDLGAGKLDVRGLATPGGLNRAFGDIPLLGPILGGGSDEGLLGITFTAQGTLADPKVRSNPVSALAPGFLRKLFESEAPLSPQPRLVVTEVAGKAAAPLWPYGPTMDMRETFIDGRTDTRVGPLL